MDGVRVVSGWKGFSSGFDGGQGLSDCVGYAAENLEGGVSQIVEVRS